MDKKSRSHLVVIIAGLSICVPIQPVTGAPVKSATAIEKTLEHETSNKYSAVPRMTVQESIDYFDKILKKNPHDYAALYRRGKYKTFSGQDDEALKDFDASLKENPLKSDAAAKPGINTPRTLRAWVFQDKAFILLTRKDYKGGIECLDHAIRLRPNYYLNYKNRGLAYRALKNPTLSNADLQRAQGLQAASLPDECLRAPNSLESEKDFELGEKAKSSTAKPERKAPIAKTK